MATRTFGQRLSPSANAHASRRPRRRFSGTASPTPLGTGGTRPTLRPLWQPTRPSSLTSLAASRPPPRPTRSFDIDISPSDAPTERVDSTRPSPPTPPSTATWASIDSADSDSTHCRNCERQVAPWDRGDVDSVLACGHWCSLDCRTMDLLNRPAFDQDADSQRQHQHQHQYEQQQQQPQQQLHHHHVPDPNKPTTESPEPRGQLIMAAESASASSEAMGMDIDSSPPTSASPHAAPTAARATADSNPNANANANANAKANASRQLMAMASGSELRGETPSPRAKAIDPFDPKVKSALSLCLDADTARRGIANANATAGRGLGRGLARSISTPQLIMCAQPTTARAKAWNTP